MGPPSRKTPYSDLPPPRYIDTDEELGRFAKRLKRAEVVAVDTESDSFHHYREKVCLIQISALGEDVIIDPLALSSLEHLRTTFADPKTTKLFHDAGYDLIGLSRDFGFRFAALFDTMLASRLLGETNFGLAPVLSARFGFMPDKRLQRSNWAQRPLTPDQIAYARFDTHFLERLAEQLTVELDELGRLAWAYEDFSRLPEVAERTATREQGPDEDAWWRLKGVKQLSPAARGRAEALYLERDRIAQRLDRPPFKVFGDAVILDLAQNPPKGPDSLRPRRGLRRAGVDRFGAQILRALKNAKPVKGRPAPGTGRKRRPGRFLEPAARKRFEDLRAMRRRLAKELGIDPDVALANAVLEDIARHPPASADGLLTIPVLTGWRRPIFVQPIIRVLQGETPSD